jgi:hypothetical protein
MIILIIVHAKKRYDWTVLLQIIQKRFLRYFEIVLITRSIALIYVDKINSIYPICISLLLVNKIQQMQSVKEGDPWMHKTLSLEDLIAKKNRENIETDPDQEYEELYDLIIPPGTVVSIIYDIVEEYGLEPVTRKMPVDIVNSEEREILVLRGPLEKVQAAEEFLYKEMRAWVEGK